MTLPTSGPLSFADIQTEFGGTNPISLSEYYAGGGLVPAGTSGTNGPVPSSGQISVANFYGTSNTIITLSPASISTASGGGASATSGYRVSFNGSIYELTGVGGVINTIFFENWCTPTTNAANYEVFTSYVGDLPSGTVNTWLSCSVTNNWSLVAPKNLYRSTTLTVSIRKTGTTTILASADIFLEADATV